MAEIVGLMDDLFFQMKVLETAKQLGLQFKVANTADSLMELIATSPKLVIVDLNARSGAIPAIERVRSGKERRAHGGIFVARAGRLWRSRHARRDAMK